MEKWKKEMSIVKRHLKYLKDLEKEYGKLDKVNPITMLEAILSQIELENKAKNA